MDTKVAAAHRARFEELRDTVRTADDGHGLPEALLHGNPPHAVDHAVLSDHGPVVINWKASGRGPRLADLAYLIWVSWLDQDLITAAVDAYRRHVEPTDDELDRLEGVMAVRSLYLMGFDFRRNIDRDRGGKVEWYDPDYLMQVSAAARTAFRK